MKVRFKTRSAGPKGMILPGDIVEVPVKEAELLVNGNYAVYVDQEKMGAKTESKSEKSNQRQLEGTEQKQTKKEAPQKGRAKPKE